MIDSIHLLANVNQWLLVTSIFKLKSVVCNFIKILVDAGEFIFNL